MDFISTPKMSLIAQYDDLCRYTKVLTEGCEEEFKTFVEGQLSNVHYWKEAENEIKVLKNKVDSLETEKKRLETQMKHIRNVFEVEVNKRKKIEEEKSSMERTIALIKDLLLSNGSTIDNQTKEKLFQLSSVCMFQGNLTTIQENVGSLLSLSDCDQTSDDIDDDSGTTCSSRKRRSKGKKSNPEDRKSLKKRKSEIENFEEDEDSHTSVKKIGTYRSSSEPASNSEVPNIQRPTHRSDSGKFPGGQGYNLRKSSVGGNTGSTPGGGRYSIGKLNRSHFFCTKTVIRTEKCYPCGRLIKFCKQALKCQDCRITCHPECKDQCPLPCIPNVNTPTKRSEGTIADFVSSSPPMIPALVVHCVNEIESRGLEELGLYRISGSEREVKELKDKFLKGKNIPCLNQIDIHAICSTVKEFLRSLKDPLVTRSSWQALVDAAEVSDVSVSLNLLHEIVSNLPQPNRETLAFLALHLQRVANSPECKMPLDSLAKVFGPTIVGYSTEDPSNSRLWKETSLQANVMYRLLTIPGDYWQNLIDLEPEVFENPTHRTPEYIPALPNMRLGPILGSNEKQKSVHTGRPPLSTTPKSATIGTTKVKRFFSSPLMT